MNLGWGGRGNGEFVILSDRFSCMNPKNEEIAFAEKPLGCNARDDGGEVIINLCEMRKVSLGAVRLIAEMEYYPSLHT